MEPTEPSDLDVDGALVGAVRAMGIHSMPGSKRQPCRFFLSPKGCNKGATCTFLHDPPVRGTKVAVSHAGGDAGARTGAVVDAAAAPIDRVRAPPHLQQRCRYFSTPAGCPYGTGCRFSHEGPAPTASTAAEAALPPTALEAPPLQVPARSVTSAVGPRAAAPAPLPSPASPCARLYIDALNYTDAFFDLHRPYNFDVPMRRVAAFARAAAASGIALRVFIDEGIATGETLVKWRRRREREVADGEKRVPHGLSWAFGDMWRRAGVPVTRSFEADNDDALAAAAQADGADVLSQDRDFFRYSGAAFRVFSDFNDRSGRLVLTRHRATEARSGVAPRALLSPPLPAGVPADAAAPWVPNLLLSRQYRRGAPSPLVRALGFNPHASAAPLRHALYQRLFAAGAGGGDAPVVVTEELPVWDAAANSVRWLEERMPVPVDVRGGPGPSSAATPSPWAALLDGPPAAAFARVFPVESSGGPPPAGVRAKDWREHCAACRAVVYELCAAATKSEFLGLVLAA
jgi:hypothetical protein